MKSFYENPSQSITGLLDLEDEYFVVQMVGKVSRSSYQKVFEQLIQEHKNYPFNKLILNIKDLQNNPDFGRQWFTTYFMRRLYKNTGGFFLAIVNPSNKLERTGIPLLYGMIEKLGVKVSLKFFDSILEAQNWIVQAQTHQDLSTIINQTKNKSKSNKIMQKAKQLNLKSSKLKLKVQFSPSGNLKPDTDIVSLPSLNLKKLKENFKLPNLKKK